MKARIYQPSKTAMQSGRAKTHKWALEFEPTCRQHLDPLMGWSGAGDTMAQVRLKFDTREDAISHAERLNLDYVVQEPKKRQIRPKAYADNFSVDRKIPWSH